MLFALGGHRIFADDRVGADVRLRFQKVAQQFMLRRLPRSRRARCERRRRSKGCGSVGQSSSALGAGESSFDNFDGGGGEIVFRAQGDDRAAAVKNVANELKRSGTHEAVRIDAQRDVVDGFAAMDGLGNHQLLVLGPRELRGNLLRVRTGLPRFDGAAGPSSNAANQAVQCVDGRRLHAALVSGQHGAESFGRSENNFGERRTAGLSQPAA